MKKKILVLVIMLLSMVGFSQTQSITVNGTSRSMIVYAPSGLSADSPLLISLHGMNQSAEYQQSTTNWEAVADTAKFVLVYPSSVGTTWDINGSTDLDFIEAIIDEMHSQHAIDLKRVYLSGFSMGGMMTYHAANNIADKIAAFAPVSGYMTEEHNSSRAIPLIHTHGTADDVVPCEAGNSGSTGAFFPGAQAIAEGWVERNNCDPTPVTTTPYPVGTSNTNTKQVWSNGDCSTEVVLIKIAGKGHWHSNEPAGVHTTREIWNFVRRFSLDCGLISNFSLSFTSPEDNAVFVEPALIPIEVSYTEGTIIDHIDFFLNDDANAFHSVNQAPYSFDWTDVAAGTYTVKAIAYDNEGNTAQDVITVTVNIPQGPYGGTAHVIPGTIQFEEFDVGGNGFAYYDIDAGTNVNPAPDYRTDEDVDIENCDEGGYNLGYTAAGEWTEYTVNVETSGVYDIVIRAASSNAEKTMLLEMDDVAITPNITVPNTGGWQAWEDVLVEGVELQAGEHILKMTIGETDYINLNYMTFSLVVSGPEITSITPPDGSEFTSNDVVTIVVDAQAATAAITSVEIFDGTTLIGSDNTAPYEIEWSGMSAGIHTLSVEVSDADGNKTTDNVSYTIIPGPSILELKAGWNLIGYPLDGSANIEDALSSVWSNVASVKDMDSFYLEGQAAYLNTLKTLEWGKGYLIKVNADCELIWLAQ